MLWKYLTHIAAIQLDFYCNTERIAIEAIELDGAQHFTGEVRKYNEVAYQYLKWFK
jgi:hypothetical protein